MRRMVVVLLGLFLVANFVGCSGSASIPEPSADAKPGPPPGTSDVWKKSAAKK